MMRMMKRLMAAVLTAIIIAGTFAPAAVQAETVQPKITGGLHFYTWVKESETTCYISVKRQDITEFEYIVYHNSLKQKTPITKSKVYKDPSGEYQICKIDNLTVRACNFISIRAKKKNGVWTSWTAKFPIVPYHRSVNRQANLANMTATISWKKIAGVNYYEVYISTRKDGGWVKVATTTNSSVKVSKFGGKRFQFGKTYYCRVLSVKKYGKGLSTQTSGPKYNLCHGPIEFKF